MVSPLQLDPWPFASGEEAVWHWIRSPRMEGPDRQWQTTAVFKAFDGSLKEVDLSWGVLPWLRLGQGFVDGRPVDGNLIGQEMLITVPMDAAISIVEAGRVIPYYLYPLHAGANLAEQCVTIRNSRNVVVIPVIECIRAFLAPNRFLAFGLLEPNYLERIVTQNLITDSSLILGFSAEIPVNVLSNPVVVHIARLLYDPSFRKAWDIVYKCRFDMAERGIWEAGIPLKTDLPSLLPGWRVRAIREGDILLVLEIIETAVTHLYPFEQICFTHPRLLEPQSVAVSVRQGNGRGPRSGEYRIDSSPNPAANARNPAVVDGARVAVIESHAMKVIRIKRPSNYVSLQQRSRGSGMAGKTTQMGQVVSLSDRGIRGRIPAADFKPKPPTLMSLRSEDGFDGFAQAIQSLKDFDPGVVVRWEVCALATETPFALLDGRARKYVCISLVWPGLPACCLIEIGRPDEHQISTLLFSMDARNSSRKGVVIDRLLNEALTAQGWWRRDKVQKIAEVERIRFSWARHVNDPADRWGGRLHEKAWGLIMAASR